LYEGFGMPAGNDNSHPFQELVQPNCISMYFSLMKSNVVYVNTT